eukprot:3462922-Alexandrium_andersonii.AAC.1
MGSPATGACGAGRGRQQCAAAASRRGTGCRGPGGRRDAGGHAVTGAGTAGAPSSGATADPAGS